MEEIDYKIKKYHGEKINQLAEAASWGLSSRRSGDGGGDWRIREYETLRVNRALGRRIVIKRWMIREIEENEDEYHDDDGDWSWRINDSGGG